MKYLLLLMALMVVLITPPGGTQRGPAAQAANGEMVLQADPPRYTITDLGDCLKNKNLSANQAINS